MNYKKLTIHGVNFNNKRKKMGKEELIVTIIVLPILIIWSLTLLFPFLWALLNTFKTPSEYFSNSFALPKEWMFSNWALAFKSLEVPKLNPLYKASMLDMMFNSLWWTTGVVVINTFFTALFAYALAKYKFKLNVIIFSLNLVIMSMPIVGAFPSQFMMYKKFGIYNSPLMLITACGCLGSSAMMIFYSYFQNISWSYAEAVFIDGGNHFTVFFKVMLPQAVPIISAMLIIKAIGVWNDYLTAYVYLRDFPTLSTGLYLLNVSTLTANNKPIYFAAVLTTAIPVFILFVAFQDKIMNSVSMGGLKG